VVCIHQIECAQAHAALRLEPPEKHPYLSRAPVASGAFISSEVSSKSFSTRCEHGAGTLHTSEARKSVDSSEAATAYSRP
jgi:hypothetical protein